MLEPVARTGGTVVLPLFALVALLAVLSTFIWIHAHRAPEEVLDASLAPDERVLWSEESEQGPTATLTALAGLGWIVACGVIPLLFYFGLVLAAHVFRKTLPVLNEEGMVAGVLGTILLGACWASGVGRSIAGRLRERGRHLYVVTDRRVLVVRPRFKPRVIHLGPERRCAIKRAWGRSFVCIHVGETHLDFGDLMHAERACRELDAILERPTLHEDATPTSTERAQPSSRSRAAVLARGEDEGPYPS
jgi:hypothetical protein